MTQREFLLSLCANNPNAYIVGSIGTISYDLATIEHDNKILIKGAMGAALGCGFGIALGTDEEVIVVIGDGSFLMKMGSMSTILKYNLPNLRVIILNNNCYKSCGGQFTNFRAIEELLPVGIFSIIEV